MAAVAGSVVRLAELIASMSLATDLGLGQPMEHVLRSCVLGLRIAEGIDLSESERVVVYYVALLAWLGCHADAHEHAAWFGDDIELRADSHTAGLITAPGEELERFNYGWSVLHCLPVAMLDADSAGTGTVIRAGTVRAYAAGGGLQRRRRAPDRARVLALLPPHPIDRRQQ